MTNKTHQAPHQDSLWTTTCRLSELEEKGQKVFKSRGKQILVILSGGKIYACNNRCPHEGYPLAEGTLASKEPGTCTLTCNWHNWKFDLTSGEAMVGGDAVRLYPTKIEGGDVFIDLSDPAPGALLPKIQDNLNEAWDDYDYDRIARELVRYEKNAGDLKDVLTQAISRSHDRFEYGMGHPFAAAADWMSLSEEFSTDSAKRLITYLEPTAHIAWDTRREPSYPFDTQSTDYNADALVVAIENEDEPAATSLIRGAANAGLTYKDIEPALARAALAHYQGFGHAAIYVFKIGDLIDHLGERITVPATLALIRELVYARREDLIPEFRGYHAALADWHGDNSGRRDKPVVWTDFKGLSVRQALARALESTADPQALYDALLAANAWNFLHFDLKFQRQTGTNISHNVDWLNFTHTITFANSVRELCTRYPELWPQGLLQMACFLGRNTPFVDKHLDTDEFTVDDPARFIAASKDNLFDHAQFEHIVSCHLVKLTMATEREIMANPSGPQTPLMTAALNRFLQSSVKRRHVLRTANQALNFVDLEG